ncbi:Signal transduction histidine kinase CheA / CheY-like domain [hydrothermal vent metagenome]|uniref:histidine kinase n=1 Tax=hydrothermal vent metagenome TaxID=652676 RepID=A0A3B0RIM0_9ZZZZ
MDDLLSDFLSETLESLEVVDAELVKFEQQPEDDETLNNIFRLVHTIKGTCGFLGLPRLEALAHAGETLLGKYRDKALVATPETVSLILGSIDQIKEILDYLTEHQVEPEGGDEEIIAQLVAASEGTMQAAPAAAKPESAPEPEPEPEPEVATETKAASTDSSDLGYDEDLDRELRPGEVSLADLEAAFMSADGPDLEQLAVEADQAKKVDAEEKAKEKETKAKKPAEPLKLIQTVRVNVDSLEDLMTMVSELVLTRNQLLQTVRETSSEDLKIPLQRLSSVTAELQEGVMKTRMQPIGNAWKKLPRVVRDSAKAVDKKVQLNMSGEDTELDRQVLELIGDPLTHMVRNSCDHGLEPGDIRVAAGKPEAGQINLSAYHEGGHIVIEIADDGAGLPTSKIRSKALKNGTISQADADAMSDNQIHRLIFAAGLSTAASVTSISGRGVGMDVVRSNIEQIGGTIDLNSVDGQGTTFKIKIPLTLAIVSALIVDSAAGKFAIPQLAVVELVRTTTSGEHQIEMLNNTKVLRLRDTLLPIVDLSEITGTVATDVQNKPAFVVVMLVGEQRFGVLVDNIFDTEEIVVKPLSNRLKSVHIFSGNTILGDGSVIMILDPLGVAREVNSGDELESNDKVVDLENVSATEKTAMLLFTAGGTSPKAVPLNLVTRLEEIDQASIEIVHDRHMVQYRDTLMPLVHASGDADFVQSGQQPILVFTDNGRSVGLAVDKIVDIVEEVLNIEMSDDAAGIIGSAVLKGQATEVLDVGHFLTQGFHDWFERALDDEQQTTAQAKRILLVDDNAFFRNMVRPLLSAAGYEVTAIESTSEAWELNRAGVDFDIIVSDIEMPDDNGVDFAKKLAEDIRWSKVPRLALSALEQADLEKIGATAAFTDVVRKSDRESLISTIQYVLHLEGEAA